VCGSEPNYGYRHFFYGKVVCKTCFAGRKMETWQRQKKATREVISRDDVRISYNLASVIGEGGGFFRLAFTLPPEEIDRKQIEELAKTAFDQITLTKYEKHDLTFEWFDTPFNIDTFQQIFSSAMLGRSVKQHEVTPSLVEMSSNNYFRMTNHYDGTDVWRCVACGSDFDTEASVREHQRSKHPSEVTGLKDHPVTESPPGTPIQSAKLPTSSERQQAATDVSQDEERIAFLRKRISQLEQEYESAIRGGKREAEIIQDSIRLLKDELSQLLRPPDGDNQVIVVSDAPAATKQVCNYCGKALGHGEGWNPVSSRCDLCALGFCSRHRSPEAHHCSGLNRVRDSPNLSPSQPESVPTPTSDSESTAYPALGPNKAAPGQERVAFNIVLRTRKGGLLKKKTIYEHSLEVKLPRGTDDEDLFTKYLISCLEAKFPYKFKPFKNYIIWESEREFKEPEISEILNSTVRTFRTRTQGRSER
jgi:hypothetical protein